MNERKELTFKNADAYLVFDSDMRFYLTGQRTSFGCVVLTRGKKFYISDSRYETALREALPDYEIIIVKKDEFYTALRDILNNCKALRAGFEDDVISYINFTELKKELGKTVKLVKSSKEYADLRAVKTQKEIETITHALKITQNAYEIGISKLRAGVTEREIAAVLIYEMIKSGADDYAFPPIVSFGANTAKPHHAPDDTPLKTGDAVMIDMGAKYRGYCADFTRTVFYGEPNPKLKEIYGIVLDAQTLALNSMKAGISAIEADSFAREYIKGKNYDKEFGHGSGHGLGVKIHDEPNLAPKSKSKLLKNMVVTVEPGIYIPDLGGVRIEDLAVITKNGAINLTTTKKNLTILKT